MIPTKTLFALTLLAKAAVVVPGPASAQVLGPAYPGRDAALAGTSTASRPIETVRELGLTPVTSLSREEEHLEIEAIAADGRRLWVSFDLAGRLWEIEDADHDMDRVAEWRALDAAAARRFITQAGFGFGRVLDEKPRHIVVSATTREGVDVVLHLDRNGYIYKQIWPRS